MESLRRDLGVRALTWQRMTCDRKGRADARLWGSGAALSNSGNAAPAASTAETMVDRSGGHGCASVSGAEGSPCSSSPAGGTKHSAPSVSRARGAAGALYKHARCSARSTASTCAALLDSTSPRPLSRSTGGPSSAFRAPLPALLASGAPLTSGTPRSSRSPSIQSAERSSSRTWEMPLPRMRVIEAVAAGPTPIEPVVAWRRGVAEDGDAALGSTPPLPSSLRRGVAGYGAAAAERTPSSPIAAKLPAAREFARPREKNPITSPTYEERGVLGGRPVDDEMSGEEGTAAGAVAAGRC